MKDLNNNQFCLTGPHWATQAFLVLRQVLILREFLLQDTKVRWHACRQAMAAAPVWPDFVLFAPDEGDLEGAATDEAATAPDDDNATPDAATVLLGVIVWDEEVDPDAATAPDEAATTEEAADATDLEGVTDATAAPDLVGVTDATAAPDLVGVTDATAAPDLVGVTDATAAPDFEGLGVAAATGDAENVGVEHSNLITRLDTPTSVTSMKRPGKSGT